MVWALDASPDTDIERGPYDVEHVADMLLGVNMHGIMASGDAFVDR